MDEEIPVTGHNLGDAHERSFKYRSINTCWGINLPITNLCMHLFRMRHNDVTAVVPGNIDVEANDNQSFNYHNQNPSINLGHFASQGVGGDGRPPLNLVSIGGNFYMENSLQAAALQGSTSTADEGDEAEGKDGDGDGYLNQLVPLPLPLPPTPTYLREIMEDEVIDDNISNDDEERSAASLSAIAVASQRNYVETTGSSNFDDLRIDEYNSQDEMTGGDEMEDDEFYYYEDAALTTAVAVVVSGVVDSSRSRGFRTNDESGDKESARPHHDEVRSA